MRLTRRGWGVVAVAIGGVVLAVQFGPRSLNAVVLPAFIALVAAAVQLRSVDAPAVERDLPADGFPGEAGDLRVHLTTDDTFTGVVRESTSAGLAVEPPAVETTVGAAPVTFRVRYERRGEHTLGPVDLTARDVLGLAETDLTAGSQARVLVYPPVRDLTPAAVGDLRALYETARTAEREEFDSLREYERGDPLRDVHWKTTAKRQDLTVKQFAADSRVEAITVAAGAPRATSPAGEDAPAVDAMAEAAASVALALLASGAPVAVHTPDGSVEAGVGAERAVLEHLARAEAGSVPAVEADVVIEATADGATVRIDETARPFAELTSDRRPARGVVDEQARAGTDDDRTGADAARDGDATAGTGRADALAGTGLGAAATNGRGDAASAPDPASATDRPAGTNGVHDGAPGTDAGADADGVEVDDAGARDGDGEGESDGDGDDDDGERDDATANTEVQA
jgi:uncharacterized protein (DUF58 family)